MNEEYQLFQKNIFFIIDIDRIIHYFRIQNNDKALRISTEFFGRLDHCMPQLSYVAGSERTKLLSNLLSELLQAQNLYDYVLLADLYELQIRRFFIELQEDIINSEGFEVQATYYDSNYEAIYQRDPELGELIYSGTSPKDLLGQGYEIEYSSCGIATLALTDMTGKYYLHSNGRIAEAANVLAKAWYQEDITSYIVFGLGLGYHINTLVELDYNISIEVYESDINVIKLAAAYTEFNSLITKPNIKIVYDPNCLKLLKRISNINISEKFVIHYPSLRNLKNNTVKEKLENYFISYSSIENQRSILNANFRENILHFDGYADELKDRFSGKDLYIVAAGPSLDKNILQLNNIGDKGIILATGTVFRKLLKLGIVPDYVIVTDANERVYSQIDGYETSNVPMLFISTAYSGFAKNYHGRKYIIFQKDFDKAEKFAAEKGKTLFHTGGSVSTTALDIGITLNCKRIIFLGLDLAFTDNYVHAADTSKRDLYSTDDLRLVEDIFGNKVYTSRNLDIYRNWIENRIRDINGIEFIDATEGGAKIAGMKIFKLSECIHNKENHLSPCNG